MVEHFRMEREAAVDAYGLIKESLGSDPHGEKGVQLMAEWQAIALNTRPKRQPREYMDLRFVKEAVAKLAQK
jgi:hypothetical protein